MFHIPVIIGVCAYVNDEEDLKRLLKAYVYACVILSIVVITAGPLSEKNQRYGWSTTGEQPNTPALNLAGGFAFAYYFWKNAESRREKAIYFAIMALLVITILLTGSRKILIYIVGYILLDALYSSKDLRKTITRIFALAVLLVLAYVVLNNIPILYEIVASRVFTDLSDDTSAIQRNYLISEGLKFFSQSPIFGNGIDTFKTVNYLKRYAHNNYVELLSGVGAVGLVTFYGYLVRVLIKLFGQRENRLSFMMFSTLLMTFVIEYWNVDYMQKGIYFIYALAFCQYKACLRSDYSLDGEGLNEGYEN